jgi:hypothetical protein
MHARLAVAGGLLHGLPRSGDTPGRAAWPLPPGPTQANERPHHPSRHDPSRADKPGRSRGQRLASGSIQAGRHRLAEVGPGRRQACIRRVTARAAHGARRDGHPRRPVRVPARCVRRTCQGTDGRQRNPRFADSTKPHPAGCAAVRPALDCRGPTWLHPTGLCPKGPCPNGRCPIRNHIPPSASVRPSWARAACRDGASEFTTE